MPKIAYIDLPNWRGETVAIVAKAIEIVDDYAERGFDLTLRQLYYQFVSEDFFANTERNYKRLGDIVNKARMAGLIDWERIVDRTRKLYGFNTTSGPDEFLRNNVNRLHLDHWDGQDYRVEVWVEKEALADVIAKAADRLRVDYFPCRGYVSASAQWRAAMRLAAYDRCGQRPVILHLGDHDPSGCDMTRDIVERVGDFMEHHAARRPIVKRIALNMDQIKQYSPPPNPAKLTDSRASGYIDRYGYQSWELDALRPEVLIDLIDAEARKFLDEDAWDDISQRQADDRAFLRAVSDNIGDIRQFMRNKGMI
jgi:hypothetical protein